MHEKDRCIFIAQSFAEYVNLVGHGLKMLLLSSSQDATTSVNQTYEFELFKLYKTM